MNRPFNFGAGPAMLPCSILKEAQEELLDWQGTGMSILEIGHRTSTFTQLLDEAEQDLRLLLDIPYNYHVLFLGGAARNLFAMIPLNFIQEGQQAGYFVTGIWSSLAFKEAIKLKNAYALTSQVDLKTGQFNLSQDIKSNTPYLYFTSNETIHGVRFVPRFAAPIPLIADMTSSLLTEPINVSDFDLIFAGAQKNIANAGLTIVIVKKDFIQSLPVATLPTMWDFKVHLQEKMLATPPTFNCYIAHKMFKWIIENGGIKALYEINRIKSQRLYDYIDASDSYSCPVIKERRSLVNICFHLKNQNNEQLFLAEAEKKGLLALKGHREAGGIRASLYNSMPLEGVDTLIDFMQYFAGKYKQ